MAPEICVILVRPGLPENIGAVARALKTMGIGPLRLVAPCDHLCPRALWMAHGSEEILPAARVYPELTEAIGDADLAIGTTTRSRNGIERLHTPAAIREMVYSKSETLRRVALVFGPEDSGLRNDELKQCDVVSSIPMANPQPSLNLAQSVMVYAYALSPVSVSLPAGNGCNSGVDPSPDTAGFAVLKCRLQVLLNELSVLPESNTYRRIMEFAAGLGPGDVVFLHAMLSRLEKRMGIGA